jgi:ubiquinone/menaquinone biosynthesis C-methylase UbiE
MQSLNTDLTKKIVQLFKEKSSEYGNTYDNVEYIIKNDTILKRHIDAFDIYKKCLKTPTRILDWGFRYAVDAYLIRTYFAEQAEIYGCDVTEEKKQNFLYDYAQLKYSQLTHQYKLPYDNSYFDVVIGSGVLEHVPNDYESLKELYRIIRNDGYLIITFLPNHLSYTEFIARKFRNCKLCFTKYKRSSNI